MKTIKIKDWEDVPKNYTGIVQWTDGDVSWHTCEKIHREDGPAYIKASGFKSWWLNNYEIWDSYKTLDLTNQIILSKTKHPEYPFVQVWKILDKDRVYEQIVIPGMEEYITE